MTEKAADDYSYIALRLKAINRHKERYECGCCKETGWMIMYTVLAAYWTECDACGNPLKKAKPE